VLAADVADVADVSDDDDDWVFVAQPERAVNETSVATANEVNRLLCFITG